MKVYMHLYVFAVMMVTLGWRGRSTHSPSWAGGG